MRIPWAVPNITPLDIEQLQDTLETGWYSMGEKVEQFEKKLADYLDIKHAVAVNNGTSALEVMFRSMNIGYGDEVIVPAFSYIASATAVNLVGATPVFIDVDKTHTIDTEQIDYLVTDKTKGVLAVDIGGNPCNYDLLTEKCEEHDIKLLVDGAQSLGSRYHNKPCISYGYAGTTSFHSAKILSTVEGGMIFTDDTILADKMKAIRNQGETKEKYIHPYLGGNYRMTDITASLGLGQLSRYHTTLRDRTELVKHYRQKLKDMVMYPEPQQHGTSCNYIFSILYKNCGELAEYLEQMGVETRRFFPRPIPSQPIYNIDKVFPMSEWICNRNLSLPLFTGLDFESIDYICDLIRRYIE